MPINSPLFAALQLAPVSSTGSADNQLIPQLPDKPTASTSSIQLYIIPTESTLFFQGFDAAEYSDRQPVLLRGCLFIRVLKPSKIKSITLSFRGKQRTDWPEGIPPKRNLFYEETDILSHTWPFYSQSNPLNAVNGGADFYSDLPKHLERDVSNLNLNESSRPHSSTISEPNSFLLKSLSPASTLRKRPATSPSLTPVDSYTDLQSVNTNPDHDANKPGHFPPGDYIYNFEHPLRPSLPETTDVTFGSVSYDLEASIVRAGAFKSKVVGKLPITLIRTPSDFNQEENEPIMITRDWEDQLRYDIVIGGKSLVLNSYLPLAFRFVPLWGKVALHRIRVYLSENLEYYCQNKKVHRMEPSKKYLLLEHKAKKGKSLLANKTEGEYGDENDEVLPRELEFQLYVPKTMNGKINHTLHPDTSFETIQAHHWIKICLRISRADPQIEGKRKHYEISIDSPIHVLSPMAAHGNTLLPAYDDHIPTASFLPEYSPTSPPLSPDVTPVDNTTSMGRLFSSMANMSSNSLHQNDSQPSVETPVAQEQFFHINSSNNNDEPIERDPDMHLEANLYKPDPDESTSQINSPQALPHPGNFSPMGSPMSRPIHMLRRPSFNPPPFAADVAPPGIDVPPPPAYDDDLSPLRIDDIVPPNIDDSQNISSINLASPKKSSSHSMVPSSSSNQISIKDLLTNSFGSVDRKNSLSSSRSQGSNPNNERNSLYSSKSSLSQNSKDGNSATSRRSRNSSDSQAKSSIGNKTDDTIDPLTVEPKEHLKPTDVPDKQKPQEEEEDIVNLVPEDLIPPAVSPRRGLSPISSPRRHPSTASEHGRDLSPLRGLNNDFPDNSSIASSRRDSLVSAVSGDVPLGDSIPLLNSSTNSVNTFNPVGGRAASVSSLLFDGGRRVSTTNTTKIMDFVDGGDLSSDLNKYNGNLLTLRNPRLKKHYNDGGISEENSEAPTQKNISDHSNASNSSYETINESNESHERKRVNITSQENIPGMKFSFVMD